MDSIRAVRGWSRSSCEWILLTDISEILLGSHPGNLFFGICNDDDLYGYWAHNGKGYWLIDLEDMPEHDIDIVSGRVTLV
jgi:hypothetical protein